MQSLSQSESSKVLDQIRTGSPKMSRAFWGWYVAAILLVVGVWALVLASSHAATALLVPAPFFLAIALMLDQRRRNAALLSEIDRLRERVEVLQARSCTQST